MSVHLTEAQARALGVTGAAKKRKKSPMARCGAASRCVTCGAEFTGDAAETRHVADTGHHRYETVIEQ